MTVPWEQDLVEAYARQGRAGDARRMLARLEQLADRTGSPVAAPPRPGAGAWSTTTSSRPSPGRSRWTTSGRCRSSGRGRCSPSAAGCTGPGGGPRPATASRAALDGFERLGADAWAGQAGAELRAAGARRRPSPDGDALTPQERRVAEAVRRGASNRAIAADLFLSPKTVEFHLRQIYRKLDVHSRTQLIVALAEPTETP